MIIAQANDLDRSRKTLAFKRLKHPVEIPMKELRQLNTLGDKSSKSSRKLQNTTPKPAKAAF